MNLGLRLCSGDGIHPDPVGTSPSFPSDGRLIRLKTGNQDADGWYAWGGNSQHNKIQ